MELNLQRILSKLCLKWAEKLIREWILQRGIRHLWKVLQIKSATWERSISAVKEIMQVAEDKGITFAVEVVNRYESSLVNTAEEAVKVRR